MALWLCSEQFLGSHMAGKLKYVHVLLFKIVYHLTIYYASTVSWVIYGQKPETFTIFRFINTSVLCT